MSLVRIIGVGTPPGSDSLALLAIDKLEKMGLQSDYPEHQLSMEKLDRPGPALLDCMQGADLVIILDALISNHATGEVVPLTPDDIAKEEWALSGHSLGVAETIALGRILGELPDNMLLLGLAVNQESVASTATVDINSATIASLQQQVANSIGLLE